MSYYPHDHPTYASMEISIKNALFEKKTTAIQVAACRHATLSCDPHRACGSSFAHCPHANLLMIGLLGSGIKWLASW